jgi:serine/threonine-protein kinase
MGEVYRAHDTKLGREVAIKVLPALFLSSQDRVARFQREARTLAALNHANIGGIHGLEESGAITALVLELVEGPTLADRIDRGPMPLDEALPIARQIADALESAHRQGIVHRDLKPANVKVRPDGVVKVLDFGLAKAMGPPEGGHYVPDDRSVRLQADQSPTITTPAMTQAGVLLGTAAYMSPEQARGKPADERADVWAFGCVLFEMLTGRRAFDGDSMSETLARVLERDPRWEMLPAGLPSSLRAYLARCLHKDPRQRVQSIGDVRLALDGAFEPVAPRAGTAAPTATPKLVALGIAAIVVAGAVGAGLLWVTLRPAPSRPAWLQVAPFGAAALNIGWNDRDIAITPDGSRLVYIGNRGTQIFVRPLDALTPIAVYTGTPRGVFMSPDGQWIGFFDGTGVLKKVAVTGGPATTLATPDTSGAAGGTWAPDDTIIVATNDVATGLRRLDASGGPLTVLTRPDRTRGEADHYLPEMLPGGRAVLFTITPVTGGLGAAQVAVLDLETGKYRTILRGGSHAQFVASGHLVYAAAGALWAVAFDLGEMQVRGNPVQVVANVVTTDHGAIDAVVTSDGTLVYVPGTLEGTPRTLVWVDRQGLETPINAPARPYLLPDLSPDGSQLAIFANDRERDIWLWDLRRTTLTRLTSDPGRDVVQAWTPDSRRLLFTSERGGARNLFSQAADGTDAVRLTDSPNTQYPSAVSPDGQLLLFSEEFPQTGIDLMAIELRENGRVTSLVRSQFAERNGIISPDGRWLAYEADDSGRFEIYVRPYPDWNRARWQVSGDGGTRPRWTKRGRELIFVSPSGALMGADVGPGPSWVVTPPALLVKEGYDTVPAWWGRSYDVSADGERFLMIKDTAPPPSLVVVQHWDQELKRLAPGK